RSRRRSSEPGSRKLRSVNAARRRRYENPRRRSPANGTVLKRGVRVAGGGVQRPLNQSGGALFLTEVRRNGVRKAVKIMSVRIASLPSEEVERVPAEALQMPGAFVGALIM
ncbi:hypothetical protein, partial [Salmonella sp. s57936]|uniref:hypothetical protein n=1 Tax=Salmonella sp. s57936 TaxID=3159698 RepID=UPI00397F11C7